MTSNREKRAFLRQLLEQNFLGKWLINETDLIFVLLRKKEFTLITKLCCLSHS